MKRYRLGRTDLLILFLLGVPLLWVGVGRAVGLDQRTGLRPAVAPDARVALVHRASAPSDAEIETMVREALDLALGPGGMAALVSPGDTVLIKPNLGLGLDAHEITSWQVVRAVARACQEAGAGQVVIGESPQLGLDHYAQAGYTTHITGVQYIDLSDPATPLTSVQAPESLWPAGEALILPQAYVAADVVISAPKVKTHGTAGITAALKNAVGVTPLDTYSTDVSLGYRDRFHQQYGIHKTIAQINLARPPDLAVADAIRTGEGNGPWGASAKQTNLIIASRDAVALDTVAAQWMGFAPWRVRHLVYAGQLGVGQGDPAHIEIVGEPLVNIQQDFAPPGNPANEANLFRGTTVLGAPPQGLALDGNLDEWTARLPLLLDTAEHVRVGAASWTGADDASLRAWLAYDATYLYLAARVTDDQLLDNSRTASNLWDGDALELYVSGANQDQAGRGAAYTANDFRLAIGYGQNMLYDIGVGRGNAVAGATVARGSLADGYTIEIRVPLAALNGLAPTRNREIGLDLAVDDADTSVNRQSQLIWSGTADLPQDVCEMGLALLHDVAAPLATETPTVTPITPTVTPSASPTTTPLPSLTPTPITPTATPSHTPTLTPTGLTPSPTPTRSLTPTPTATTPGAATPTPSPTVLVTPSPTEPLPTATMTPTSPWRLNLPLLLVS